MKYLRYLRSSGWRLPEDQMQQEHALADIAYDTLGPFLASNKNQLYFVIFDYFDRHGLSKSNATLDTIAEHFRILLRGFVRKELTLIRGFENPQIKNIKRRVKEVLSGPDYGSKEFTDSGIDCVFAIHHSADLRDDHPLISSESLDEIVRTAFRLSLNRSEWCARIFELLDEISEVRSVIPKYRLISNMVAVNAEYVDAVGIVTGHLPTPREEYLRQTIGQLMCESLDWLQTSVIPGFVDKGRLKPEDAPLVIGACRSFLNDMRQDGDAGKIPQYFLPLKPELSQSEYLKRYKYIMDTAVSRVVTDLRQRLRANSTIWPFGTYSPDKES